MYHRILATLALSFVFYIGSSQISYHRLYETTLNDQAGMNDTTFFHMSSTTLSGDVYAMGTKRVGQGTADFEDLSIIFTKHNDKGNIDWSKELDLGQDTVKFLETGSVGAFAFNSTEDSILFTIGIEINGNRSEIFGKLDAGGNQLEISNVGGFALGSIPFSFPNVTPFINQSDLLVTTSLKPTISRIGLGNDLIWSRSYDFLNSNGDASINFISDITTTVDSTIVITGLGSGGSDAFVIAELDSNGVQIWAESYTFGVANLLGIFPVAVEPLSNGNFAVSGSYSVLGTFTTNSFVAIVDTAGSTLLSKKLYIEEDNTTITNLIEGADGTLWMSGTSEILDTTRYFTTNMNIDGSINWTTIYPQEAASATSATSLLNVQSTGGATFIGHGLLDDTPVMQVMKHDFDGTTPCSDTITIFVEDLTIVEDTLVSQVDNGGIFFDSIAYELNNFSGFSPPTLTINQYAPFCPNELIDTLLIATVDRVEPENITYLWSTQEINDTIRVMMEGQYSVTVTITEDVCYSMCDTVELTRLMVPQIAITQDNSRFCLEKIIVLTGNYTPGAANQTYLWNTGATTESIEVAEAGVYSVTVTDDCGETAADDMDVSLPDLSLKAFTGVNSMDYCDNDGIIINAGATGLSTPLYTWSTGQIEMSTSGSSIIVTESGTYQVTITDECGESEILSEVIEIPILPTSGEITYELECDETNNALSTVVFTGETSGDSQFVTLDITDLNDAINSQTGVNPSSSLSLSTYLVELYVCNTILLDSLTINTSALCGGLLQYPIAFFPSGQDIGSMTFGPIPNDTMNVERITDVDFKVFNRWGETVFESNAILEAWDGTHKDEPAPSEVYIWYVSYFIDGVEMLDKGDVTLIR